MMVHGDIYQKRVEKAKRMRVILESLSAVDKYESDNQLPDKFMKKIATVALIGKDLFWNAVVQTMAGDPAPHSSKVEKLTLSTDAAAEEETKEDMSGLGMV